MTNLTLCFIFIANVLSHFEKCANRTEIKHTIDSSIIEFNSALHHLLPKKEDSPDTHRHFISSSALIYHISSFLMVPYSKTPLKEIISFLKIPEDPNGKSCYLSIISYFEEEILSLESKLTRHTVINKIKEKDETLKNDLYYPISEAYIKIYETLGEIRYLKTREELSELSSKLSSELGGFLEVPNFDKLISDQTLMIYIETFVGKYNFNNLSTSESKVTPGSIQIYKEDKDDQNLNSKRTNFDIPVLRITGKGRVFSDGIINAAFITVHSSKNNSQYGNSQQKSFGDKTKDLTLVLIEKKNVESHSNEETFSNHLNKLNFLKAFQNSREVDLQGKVKIPIMRKMTGIRFLKEALLKHEGIKQIFYPTHIEDFLAGDMKDKKITSEDISLLGSFSFLENGEIDFAMVSTEGRHFLFKESPPPESAHSYYIGLWAMEIGVTLFDIVVFKRKDMHGDRLIDFTGEAGERPGSNWGFWMLFVGLAGLGGFFIYSFYSRVERRASGYRLKRKWADFSRLQTEGSRMPLDFE